MNTIDIAIFQMHIEDHYEKNISKVISATEHLVNKVIILPELFSTGFNYEYIKSLDEYHIDSLKNLPSHNTYIGSVARKCKNGTYNSFFVKQGDTIDFVYDKIHLFPLMDEDKYFIPGDKITDFELCGIKCGASVCFDLRFPEMFRTLFKRGCKLIFMPAEWPLSRREHLITLASARAIENQAFFILSNAAGNIWGETFGGSSRIIAPNGNILLDLENGIDILGEVQIDASLTDEMRQKIPVRDFARYDLY